MRSYINNGLPYFWRKKLLKVAVPFWLAELIGLILTNNFDVKIYIYDFLFLRPATAYGWFLQYIIICYLLFWLVMKVLSKKSFQKKPCLILLSIAFIIWFIIDSLWLCSPVMPFLKSRQMLSFLVGTAIALYYKEVQLFFLKKALLSISVGILFGGGMTIVTQFQLVKDLPYIVSNFMSLFTVLPLAIGVIGFSTCFSRLFKNKLLLYTGALSYELYLIHSFTLEVISSNWISMLLFTLITTVLAYMLYLFNKFIYKKERVISQENKNAR